MENKRNMEHEIEATLNSLDDVGRAEAPAYFYTKLEARMQRAKTPAADGFLQQILNRPALAVSALTVFLVMNIIAIRGVDAVKKTSQATKEGSSIQNFASEYNMNTTAVYNN